MKEFSNFLVIAFSGSRSIPFPRGTKGVVLFFRMKPTCMLSVPFSALAGRWRRYWWSIVWPRSESRLLGLRHVAQRGRLRNYMVDHDITTWHQVAA